jgi:hypothetical protein
MTKKSQITTFAVLEVKAIKQEISSLKQEIDLA